MTLPLALRVAMKTVAQSGRVFVPVRSSLTPTTLEPISRRYVRRPSPPIHFPSRSLLLVDWNPASRSVFGHGTLAGSILVSTDTPIAVSALFRVSRSPCWETWSSIDPLVDRPCLGMSHH